MSESADESPVEMGPLDAGDERLWLAEKVSASLGCDVAASSRSWRATADEKSHRGVHPRCEGALIFSNANDRDADRPRRILVARPSADPTLSPTHHAGTAGSEALLVYAEDPARSRAQPPPPAAEAVREPDSTGHAPDAAAEEGATDVPDAPDADAAPPATVPESHLASEGTDADPAPAPEPAPALDGDGDGEATATTDTETREGADAAALATDGEPPRPGRSPRESTSPDDKSVPLAADAPAEDDVSPTPEPSATAPISEPEPESAPEPEEPLTLDPRPMRLRVTLGGLPDDAADAPAMFFLKDSQKAALGDAEALDRGTQCGAIADPSGRSSRSNRCWSRCSCPCSAREHPRGPLRG